MTMLIAAAVFFLFIHLAIAGTRARDLGLGILDLFIDPTGITRL